MLSTPRVLAAVAHPVGPVGGKATKKEKAMKGKSPRRGVVCWGCGQEGHRIDNSITGPKDVRLVAGARSRAVRTGRATDGEQTEVRRCIECRAAWAVTG